MLLRITELGTKDQKRLYAIQTHTGFVGIVRVGFTLNKYGQVALQADVSLAGTEYNREYPIIACALPQRDPPRIDDLEGGYRTLGAFLAAWEHATEEQRADLCQYDQDIWYKDRRGSDYRRTGLRNRDKWPTRRTEDRPRQVKAAEIDGAWHRVSVKDLKAALKGTKAAVRIGSVTVKPSVIKDLCATIGTQTIDLADAGGALQIRSVDRVKRDGMETIGHRTQCTLRHGAGDPYAGRNGFEARIELARAA